MKIIKKYANLKNKMNQIKSIIISSSIVEIKERIFDSITNQLISIRGWEVRGIFTRNFTTFTRIFCYSFSTKMKVKK